MLATATATPAMAQVQQWNSYHWPGTGTTTHDGSNGWSGTSQHWPGTNTTDTDITGPDGHMHLCTTMQWRGYATTNCD